MKKLSFNYSSCPKCQNPLKRVEKTCVICGNKKVVDKPKTMIIWSVSSMLSIAILLNVSQFTFETLCPEGTVEGLQVQCNKTSPQDLIAEADNAKKPEPAKLTKVNKSLCSDTSACVLAEDVDLDEIEDPEIRALYKVHQDQARQYKKIKTIAGTLQADK